MNALLHYYSVVQKHCLMMHCVATTLMMLIDLSFSSFPLSFCSLSPFLHLCSSVRLSVCPSACLSSFHDHEIPFPSKTMGWNTCVCKNNKDEGIHVCLLPPKRRITPHHNSTISSLYDLGELLDSDIHSVTHVDAKGQVKDCTALSRNGYCCCR